MKTIATMIFAAALFACTYQTTDTYLVSETGKRLPVEYAIVVSSREVTVTEDPDVSKNWYGPVAGATLSGVAAQTGGASDAIVLGAAVIGLGLGYLIEEAAETRKGHEYVLHDEQTDEQFAIVVSVDDGAELLAPGTPVRIIGKGGYQRVEREMF